MYPKIQPEIAEELIAFLHKGRNHFPKKGFQQLFNPENENMACAIGAIAAGANSPVLANTTSNAERNNSKFNFNLYAWFEKRFGFTARNIYLVNDGQKFNGKDPDTEVENWIRAHIITS